MREMPRVCIKILSKESLLMFDCGANTPNDSYSMSAKVFVILVSFVET